MLRYVRFIALVGALAVILAAGCTDRGTNTPAAPPHAGWAVWPTYADHVFVPAPRAITDTVIPSQLLLQIENSKNLLEMSYYIPVSDTVHTPDQWKNKRMPLLVLLAPQDGNRYFYLDHGLAEVASELIANGTIRPMVIVMVASSKGFGGQFYGNSVPAGHMDDVLGQLLVDSLEQDSRLYGYIDTSHSMVGIGGVGMGAYGAFRAAIKHPGVYHNVTVADGPLDFDGSNGNGGFIPLIQQVFLEQPSLTPANFKTSFFGTDPTTAMPVSRMFIGGSLAFSPHDTLARVEVVLTGPSSNPTGRRVRILSREQLTDPLDSVTLVTSLYPEAAIVISAPNQGIGFNTVRWDIHLPFDGTGTLNTRTWDRWMANNLENMLSSQPSALDGVNMWIATTPDADYGFAGQTESWISTLEDNDYDLTVKRFSGTPQNPASGNRYTYDLLKEMLIYQSNAFGN